MRSPSQMAELMVRQSGSFSVSGQDARDLRDESTSESDKRYWTAVLNQIGDLEDDPDFDPDYIVVIG